MPFEVPNGWVWCKLGDIFQHNNGKQKTSSNQNGKLLKYITTSNVYWGRFDLSEIKEMRFLESELAKCTAKRGDLLVCEGGDIGRAAIWDYDQIICFQNHLHRLRGFVPICTKYFLFSLMFCKIKGLIKGKGIGLMTLSANDLHNIPIPLPPLAEQQRIVTEVDRWFALIDQIEQSQSDLQVIIKNTKNKILDLAIHGRLVPQDPNDEPASELLKRINPKAEITCDNGHSKKLPQSWIICRLGEICKVENGYAFSSDEYKPFGTPLVRISNIVNDKIDLSSCVFIQGDVEEKFIVSKGDLLIAMSGATTGKMGIYSQNEISYLNQRVGNIKILNKDLLLPEYRNYFMISKMDDILKLAYGGAQPNISAKIISNFLLPLPPISEQQRIVAKIEELFSILDDIQKSLEA